MNGRTAGFLFLGVCIILAILLLTKTISSTVSGALFAVALIIFGGLSRGFKKSREDSQPSS